MTSILPTSSTQFGYARVSADDRSLHAQLEALHTAGLDPKRVYFDRLSGSSTREKRPGLAALLSRVRPGDAIVVVGIDRLARNAAEVMTTLRELRERGIGLRSLREGIDTSTTVGRMVAGVMASLAELELELSRDRVARRARGQTVGRPRALNAPEVEQALRMHTTGAPVATIATALGVSRTTVYRVLAERNRRGNDKIVPAKMTRHQAAAVAVNMF